MFCDRLLTPFLRFPHFRGKTRLEALFRRMLWTPHQTVVAHKLRMELDLAEWTQMQLMKQNWLEPLTLKLYESLLKPGDTFIDVGAHVGFHSLVARHLVGPNGLIIAIEPQPYNAQKILANWRANGFVNLKLYVAAAGPQNGWVTLHDQVVTDRSVLTLLEKGGKNQAQGFEVPLIRLDSVIEKQQVKRIKVLKLDVEGYESEVMKGLGELQKRVDNIIFEFFAKPQFEKGNQNLLSAIETAGYKISTIDGQPWTGNAEIREHNLWASRNPSR
jgi:FkbM family methyltransferase